MMLTLLPGCIRASLNVIDKWHKKLPGINLSDNVPSHDESLNKSNSQGEARNEKADKAYSSCPKCAGIWMNTKFSVILKFCGWSFCWYLSQGALRDFNPCNTANNTVTLFVSFFKKFGHKIAKHWWPYSGNESHLPFTTVTYQEPLWSCLQFYQDLLFPRCLWHVQPTQPRSQASSRRLGKTETPSVVSELGNEHDGACCNTSLPSLEKSHNLQPARKENVDGVRLWKTVKYLKNFKRR